MSKVLMVVAAAALVVAAVAGGSPAKPQMNFQAKLDKKQEVPAPTGAPKQAAGTWSGSLSQHKLKWVLTFRKLSGAADSAHIHMAPKGTAGDVIVALCGPCKNGQKGTATVDVATVDALLTGNAYVNVHTAANPDGEIRGQIKKAGAKP
ncbi:MAG: CHRD domain-containing protein [Gaiellaceae bacterium]